MFDIPENKPVIKEAKDIKFLGLTYGKAMSGKTTLLNTFDNALNLNTDGNDTNIDKEVVALDKPPINTGEDTKFTKTGETFGHWEYFKNYLSYLSKNNCKVLKDKGYETLIIDSLDHLYKYCRTHMLKKWGINDEGEKPSGTQNAWVGIREEFFNTIILIKKAFKKDFNILFVSYEAIKTFKRDGIEQKNVYYPSIMGMINSSDKEKPPTNDLIALIDFSFRLKETKRVEEKTGEIFFARTLVTRDQSFSECSNRYGLEKEIDDASYKKIIQEIQKVSEGKK